MSDINQARAFTRANIEQCDEEKPSCQNCVKYGVDCPGYDKGFKFVTARTHRRKRAAVNPTKPGQSSKLSPENPSEVSTPSSQSSRTSEKAIVPKFEALPVKILYEIDATQDQALAIVIEDLFGRPSAGELKPFLRLFSRFPERLGRNRVLDTAIRCFFLHHLGKIKDDDRLVNAGRASYVEGLHRLQRALDHRRHWASSETFSSIAVLMLYEMFACPTGYDGWMQHATGMAKLAELRGPEGFMNSFDRMVFIAFKGIWIMDALFSGKDTFLRQPEWAKVTAERWDPSSTLVQHELMEELGTLLAFFPALVRDGIHMRGLASQSLVDVTEVANLTNRTLELYYIVKPWWEKWIAEVGAPEEVPSSTDDLMFPVVTKYSSFANATISCAYFAMMIILQEVLKACNYPQDFSAENTEFVNDICKAVEYNGSGTFGPFRMGFSIRIAMEVAPTDIKKWIIKWLERASKTYAVTAPANFPSLEDRPTLDLVPLTQVMEGRKNVRQDIVLGNEPSQSIAAVYQPNSPPSAR